MPIERRRRCVLGIDQDGGNGQDLVGLRDLAAGIGEENRAQPSALKTLINGQASE